MLVLVTWWLETRTVGWWCSLGLANFCPCLNAVLLDPWRERSSCFHPCFSFAVCRSGWLHSLFLTSVVMWYLMYRVAKKCFDQVCTCSHEDVVRRALQLSSIDPLGEPGRLVARILREMMGSHRTGFGTWHNRRETYLNGLLARSHREPQDAPACPSVGLLHLLVLHVISTMTSHKPNRNSEFFDPCLHLKSRTMTS